MGKKILDSKALYVALSILIALSLWFYVTAMDGREDSKVIRGVPVTFTGVDILEDRNLMVVGDNHTTSLNLRAAPTVLALLTNQTVQVTANVSNISTDGEHTLAYAVTLPAGVNQSQVEIVSGVSGNIITVKVAGFSRREIELQGEFTGTAAEGYIAGDKEDFLFSPEKLVISGQQELVNQVSYAKVSIGGENLTDTVSGEFPFQLIGASGDVLENLDVTCDVESVYVTFPIQATATVPLKVNFISGGGVDASEVSYELSMDSITVAGNRDAVEALKNEGAITLATINLATVNDGDMLSFPIPLADELTNISGGAEATVTISWNKALVTQTREATHISYINLPDGWRANIVTKVLPVEIRGSEARVAEITEENLRVVVDLRDINLATGQYIVPATVYLDSAATPSEIGVLSGDHRIVVNLSKRS